MEIYLTKYDTKFLVHYHADEEFLIIDSVRVDGLEMDLATLSAVGITKELHEHLEIVVRR